ncbi:cytidylate kinase [Naumannella cuiyingiana]|uniref:Cytidylate kinase n=1 Tax=Naumannella cuiyingiana TaxID=1347891 RepID=A0A7Z0D5Y0_9ACTN|nr:cytidylate kinase [Naumannella cuiyingiana]
MGTGQEATIRLVVAIDGPSGSGKSSAARGVARRLGLAFLDTGAMYRAGAWLALDRGVDLADTEATARLVRAARLDIVTDPDAFAIAIADIDVTAAIREPRISAAVSRVATNLAVREDLIARQRAIIAGAERGIVAEGRDITTVVAPDADVRVLLVADADARVRRRHTELGQRVSAADVTDQVVRRDADDSTVANFTTAADGVTVIDSTALDLAGVIDRILALADAGTGTEIRPSRPGRP